ncbi:MAG: polynucleotide adenylyltransferase PcnB [Rhabdochlamydiaceae bacterium]|nr:polynucleotide adenylyltransferase PcnB [Rhabdochlamydiaceae bacterium]
MERKTYPVEEHQLSVSKIDPDALYILEKLRAAGFIAYLVGGSVRDLLLNQKPKDYDISTSAEPEQIKKLFRNCILIGRRFRLAHIRFGKKIIEVSTFRSGDNENDTLIVRDNVWGTPEEDVKRRDFTINGLFYDAATQEIIDFVGGYPDIQKKYLRTIGQPFIRFKQDPVRMIRLLKFQARFGFEVDPPARIALLECRGEIVKSSSARIQEELLRMLESSSSESFFRLMTEHGILHLLMPVLGDVLESNEGGEIYSYLQEIDTTFHEPPRPLLDRTILLACLVYPILQKRIQTRYIDRERNPHLGEIYEEVHDQINEIFHPFFLLPRRLRVGLTSILTGQYRLTPIDKKKQRRLRVPNDPEFPKALDFLEVRCCLEPGLKQIYDQWKEIVTNPPSEAPLKRRRRRRRSRSSE